MPLINIRNQPWQFPDLDTDPMYSQDCLNNDNRAYAQLVEPTDKICIQWGLTPCTEDLLCEPDMYDGTATSAYDPADDVDSGGWTSNLTGTITYDGTGGVVGSITNPIAGTIVPGATYQITFQITSVTGNASVTIRLGLNIHTVTYDTTGTYYCYLIAQNAADDFEIIMNPAATTAGDTMTITNVAVTQWTACWLDELSAGYNSWTVEPDTDNVNYYYGKFCALDTTAGDLINTNAYTTDGEYHRVTFRVSNLTTGGIQVLLGGADLGTATANGTYTYYGTPFDASNELRFVKVDLFDGCIDQVTVSSYGALADYDFFLADTTGAAVSDTFNPTLADGRLFVNFDFNTLLQGGNPLTPPCGLYKWAIYDPCADDTFYSNLMNYDPNGHPCSHAVNGQCDGTAYGLIFVDSTGTAVFDLVQRLRVLQFNPKYPAKGEEYLLSDGSTLRPYGESTKIREVLFDRVDEATHDVIRLQMLCERLSIDGVQFYCPVQDYEPEWANNGKYNLAQSRVELIRASEASLFKRYC